MNKKPEEKAPWDMTNEERLKELWRLFYRADTILESFSRKDYGAIDSGAVYSLPNCVKWGMQGISELKGTVDGLPQAPDAQADSNMIKSIFSVIDTAVALAGFKVLDGDAGSVIIRHCESDTDYEIKVGEIPG